MFQLKEINICPGNEEKHYRIFLWKYFPLLGFCQCNVHVNSLAATCGNIILPTQGNYLRCRSLRAEICSIEDSNTFLERLPALNRK